MFSKFLLVVPMAIAILVSTASQAPQERCTTDTGDRECLAREAIGEVAQSEDAGSYLLQSKKQAVMKHAVDPKGGGKLDLKGMVMGEFGKAEEVPADEMPPSESTPEAEADAEGPVMYFAQDIGRQHEAHLLESNGAKKSDSSSESIRLIPWFRKVKGGYRFFVPDWIMSWTWDFGNGLTSLVNSVLGAPQVTTPQEFNCPEGEDCTMSVVIDKEKQWPTWFPFALKPAEGGFYGVCYNAPAYYAKNCIMASAGANQSPNAKAVIAAPDFVYNTSCEARGYDPNLAFYSDPFYGKANNVSIFVSFYAEWLPISYLFAACPQCMSSLAYGWGDNWKLWHPQCA